MTLQNFKDYFTFNRRERNGIIVLISIITILILLPLFYPYFIKTEASDFTQFKKDIDAFEKSIINEDNQSLQNQNKEFDFSKADRSVVENKLTPFPFDPNNLASEQWKALGLNEKQIKTIKNYEAKGGKFYKKEDFKKMYCITATEYSILEPYITIKETHNPVFKNTFKKTASQSKIIELNTADTTELKTIKGIGSYFSKRIISYRKLLGGYADITQLLEVKGMDSTRYQMIKDNFTVNTKYIVKLNINTASFDELKKHPYIGYNIALSLTNYRKMHGKYAVLYDIRKSALITESVYQRISPYLIAE